MKVCVGTLFLFNIPHALQCYCKQLKLKYYFEDLSPMLKLAYENIFTWSMNLFIGKEA
jgi:hypothetical protein